MTWILESRLPPFAETNIQIEALRKPFKMDMRTWGLQIHFPDKTGPSSPHRRPMKWKQMSETRYEPSEPNQVQLQRGVSQTKAHYDSSTTHINTFCKNNNFEEWGKVSWLFPTKKNTFEIRGIALELRFATIIEFGKLRASPPHALQLQNVHIRPIRWFCGEKRIK